MRKTLNEIAAIAEQMNNYAECVTIDGKEFKLVKNNIEEDEWWWYGGVTTSEPNVYECENEDRLCGKDQVLYFKFGFGYERESIARIIMTEDDAYMVIDGKVYKFAYIIKALKLTDDFDYDDLREKLENHDFVIQNTNGKYIYVEHETCYRPITYFNLKIHKACDTINFEKWGEYGKKFGLVCRSNGKVLERIEW